MKLPKAGYEESTSDVIQEAIRQLMNISMASGLCLRYFAFCWYEFQKSVWRKLLEIPYGSTVSYGELAGQLNVPAIRAVAAANGANAISILLRAIV